MSKQKILHFLKITALTILVCFSILFFSYHLAYAKKVIPGVKVAGISLGNKSQEEVKTLLEAKFNDRASQPVKLAAADKNFEYTFENLGISYDREKTVAAAFKVGRSGNLFDDLNTEVRSWFEGVGIEPTLRIDSAKLDGVLLAVAEEVDDPPAEAKFRMENEELRIKEEKSGRVVNQEKVKAEIFSALKHFSTVAVEIPLEDVKPEISAADLESVKPQVEKIITTNHKLVYGNQKRTPTKEEVLTFLKFQKEAGEIKIAVSESTLSDYIKKIAAQINREPKGNLFQLEGERVVEFRLASDGLKLDEEKTLEILSDAILNSQETVSLPVEVFKPLRSANDYGIKELLGTGVSNFAGSIQGRINNIKTASAKLRGILVAPGETFSFNKALGEVSASTGYDYAYIIKEGRTVLGTGGGVCQVSTTVFRAAFNSGLEILERTAHAYRVHYYEPPLGFDATVFDPSPDLVFKNDTGNYILIWSTVDVPNTTLIFSFYGTSDGRSTKMIGPFVSGETPPPAPLYQEDPTLPKGTTQQIDFPAWGATAVLQREVYRNGEVLHNDTFTSHYKPWQAVFLVGTRQ